MANAVRRNRHTITVCTTCRREDPARTPGETLIEQSSSSHTPHTAGGLPVGFAIAGIECMARCSRAVAFQAEGKATCLFGDIDPAEHLEALDAFARQYERSPDGWTRCAKRPAEPADRAPARVPSLTTGTGGLMDV